MTSSTEHEECDEDQDHWCVRGMCNAPKGRLQLVKRQAEDVWRLMSMEWMDWKHRSAGGVVRKWRAVALLAAVAVCSYSCDYLLAVSAVLRVRQECVSVAAVTVDEMVGMEVLEVADGLAVALRCWLP